MHAGGSGRLHLWLLLGSAALLLPPRMSTVLLPLPLLKSRPLCPPLARWHQLQRFTLMFDDQVNWPAECCRAALGFVVASGGAGE